MKSRNTTKMVTLTDVLTDVTDKDISILIGVDLPHLQIFHDAISGDQNEPVAMLTKLRWVLLGGNNHKAEISINHITSDRNLERLVERFWDIECCEIAN